MFTWSENPYQDMWNHLRVFAQPKNVEKLLFNQLSYHDNYPVGYKYDSTDTVVSKAKQVAMCIRQADEYFQAAEVVTITTSPLLLFYGVSSLSKALIVARRPEIQLTDINYHGLDTRPKSSAMKNYQKNSNKWELEKEYAYVNQGVFTEFCQSLLTHEFENGTLFKFKSLLKMYPEISELYQRYYGEPAPILYASSLQEKNDPYILSFTSDTKHRLEENVFPELDILFKIRGNDRSRNFVSKELTGFPKEIGYFSPYVGGNYIVRGVEYQVTGKIEVRYCHPAAVDFIGLFILSSCVRYKQLLWRSLIEGHAVGSLGIILPYVQTIRRRFPNFILDYLTGEKHDYGTPGRWV